MKKFTRKIKTFFKDRCGLVSPEYMIVALVIIAAAGIIGVGYATHANTQADATTTQMDTSFSSAQTKATTLTQP